MYEDISANRRNSFLLIFLFVAVIGMLGYVFGQLTYFGYAGVGVAVAIAVAMSIGSYYYSDRVVLTMSRAKLAERDRYPHLFNAVEGLAIAAGVPAPRIYVIEDSAPNAFATGRDPEHAALAVTSGLLDKMDRYELEGVVAHEMSHIKNYDIRLMTLAVVMVGIILLLSDWLLRSLFWGLGGRDREESNNSFGVALMVAGLVLAILAPIFAQLLKLAISRQREYLADASGAMLTRYPEGLANALRKLAADPEPLDVANRATAPLYIFPPKQRSLGGKVKQLWSTHPPLEERIARLDRLDVHGEAS